MSDRGDAGETGYGSTPDHSTDGESVAKKMLADIERDELFRMEALLRIRETRLDFAIDHHRNTNDEKMNIKESNPHIREWYTSIDPDIRIMGSVQSFKSEFIVIDHFAMAYNGIAVFFVVPKIDMRNAYVQTRVNSVIQRVDEYRRLITEGSMDNMIVKQFGKGTIKYVGSNVLADFREFPAHAMVVEEVDQCDQGNLTYAEDRLRASIYQFKRYVGNPSESTAGIAKYFLEGDQRYWHVPCLECGRFHEMDWFETVVEGVANTDGQIVDYKLRDEEWKPGCGRDVRVRCPDCGGTLDRYNQQGFWKPKEPGRKITSYQVSMLCSPFNSVASMYQRFLQGTSDPVLMKKFFNSDLGKPFAMSTNRITPLMLDRCIEKGYRFVVNNDERIAHVTEDRDLGPTAMGVDVGGTLDVQITKAESGRKRRLLFAGKIRPDIEMLVHLAQRYGVEKAVIDSGPEPTLVEDFQSAGAEAGFDVWSCRFGTEGSDKRPVYDSINRQIVVDRTNAMDRTFGQIKSGKNLLPENYKAMLGGEFVEEMCNPTREKEEDGRGNQRFVWKKGKDHQRLTDVYAYLASQLSDESTIGDVVVG